MYQNSPDGIRTGLTPPSRQNRGIRRIAAASTLGLALGLWSCGSSGPTEPAPLVPSATPTATPAPTPTATSAASQYAGSWRFTIWLTAVDKQCGHSESEIEVRVGPIPVTVAANGSFSVPSPVGASGTIDSAGDVRVSFAERSTCPSGSGLGGCVNVNHCDGTSIQGGDVSKWTLVRP